MGMLIELIGTPIVKCMDILAAFRVSWVPIGILILIALSFFALIGSYDLLETAIPRDEDDKERDKVFIKSIFLALNFALISVYVTEYPGESFMLSVIASDMNVGNFPQWHVMSKFFFWCGVINAASIIITQIIMSKRWLVIFSLLLTFICGTAFGYALIPLSLWLCYDVSMLFGVLMPLAEALLIGAMYIGSVFGIIPIDIADVLARNAEKNRRRAPRRTQTTAYTRDVWDEAVDDLCRAVEEASRENEVRRPHVEVTRRNGFFIENLKVSSDGERYYDDRDGEWHRIDDIDR